MEILLETDSNISHQSMRSFLSRAGPIIAIGATTSGENDCSWLPFRVTELKPGKWGAVCKAPKTSTKWKIAGGLFTMADGFCHEMEVVNLGSGDLRNQQRIQ